MQKMKKISYICCFLAFLFSFVISVSAHGGRTDGNGGHNSDSGYHYHHGYPAHQHYDIDDDGQIDCPYDFDDKTDHSPGDKNTTNKYQKPSLEAADKEVSFFDIVSKVISVVILTLLFTIIILLCGAGIHLFIFALVKCSLYFIVQKISKEVSDNTNDILNRISYAVPITISFVLGLILSLHLV